MSADLDAHGDSDRPREATSQPESDSIGGRLARVTIAWRRWRHSRPFWGGLFVLLGGAIIILSERGPLPIMVHIGLQGAAGYLLPTILLLCGLLLWFNPAQRSFYSLLAVLLALGSWITSNLGGFLVGMLLGMVGGSLAFAWQPSESTPAQPKKEPKPKRVSAGLSLIMGKPQSQPDAPVPGDASPEEEEEPLGPGYWKAEKRSTLS